MLATETSYPWWFILVFVFGAGGLGTIIYQIVSKGWKAFNGVMELLVVFRGQPGGSGRREVKPLVDVVDGMKETQDHMLVTQGEIVATLQTMRGHMETISLEQANLRLEVTPNGGNTDRLGDQVLRTGRALQEHIDNAALHHEEVPVQ